MNALNDVKKAGLEKAMKSAEDNAGEMAPAYVKPFFACCGGPVETLKKFECVVPADKKDDFNKAGKQYHDIFFWGGAAAPPPDNPCCEGRIHPSIPSQKAVTGQHRALPMLPGDRWGEVILSLQNFQFVFAFFALFDMFWCVLARLLFGIFRLIISLNCLINSVFG